MERTAYSSERSLMSWIRTSVSLYSFGFSISMFIDYLESSASDFSVGLRRLAIVLIAFGAVALMFAMVEHLKRIHIMKQLGLGPMSPLSLPVGAATALLAVGVSILLPMLR
jgi:putative membrane protein